MTDFDKPWIDNFRVSLAFFASYIYIYTYFPIFQSLIFTIQSKIVLLQYCKNTVIIVELLKNLRDVFKISSFTNDPTLYPEGLCIWFKNSTFCYCIWNFFFGFRPRFSSHFKEITLYEITLHVGSISSIRTILKGPVSDSSL